jgi:threonine/homoserine/homoserine lactone efflux protein
VDEAPLDSEEATPEELQRRIEAFRQRRGTDGPGFGRAMALVMSLGVSLVAVMYGAYVLGGLLKAHTGSAWALPLSLLLGAAAAGWVGYLLIRPLLREDT